MEIFFWFIDLLIPVTMIILGKIINTNPPKEINNVCGYRTTRSMESKDAWNYANTLCGKLWFKIGIILFILIVILKLIIPIESQYLSLVNVGIGLVALIMPIPFIEMKLKSKFHK
ncbi:SdpI family protein [Clostridium senegalense]|uniref:SdpI family protein n=1 Tax=Clostridium senegalense TaxID=1465809 RepID=UPI001C0FC9C8|nr:SdpI family protein [Clostridium senegalense]MBU5228025.1 SdpI family protein [Clostridium senegalense]